VAVAVNFSTTADRAGDYQRYSGDASCRWRHPERVRIVERPGGGLLYRDFATAQDGQADAELELALRSGHYLLTLNVYDAEEDTGPFSVLGPDGPLFEDVAIPRGQYWCRTAHLRSRDGTAALRFTGRWKVGALALQSILYEAEDFVLDRPFWNATIPIPATD